MKYLIAIILAIYIWKGWVFETDRPVVIIEDVLCFADTKQPVPAKERCKA